MPGPYRSPERRGHVTWNPAGLGIGTDRRDIPVYVSEHSLISRLHERMAIFLDFPLLHQMAVDLRLDEPKLQPTEGADGFLVELGLGKRKAGYFVAEVYPEFVFVKTFLFLTMQGTPEARCCAETRALARDIEYYKLDSCFTLTCSDLGDDPDFEVRSRSAGATICSISPSQAALVAQALSRSAPSGTRAAAGIGRGEDQIPARARQN